MPNSTLYRTRVRTSQRLNARAARAGERGCYALHLGDIANLVIFTN